VAVPARLARHVCVGGGAAAVGDSGLHRHVLLGFTINVVTLLALSLVVGILVDDAIVEVENIVRHLRMGKTPYQAAMEAADEIGLAVIATTFTLIAVFLPTAFMSGMAGKFFKQFGWTAALAVFASLVVARMLTPMMAAYIMKPPRGRARRAALDAAVPALGALVPAATAGSPCWGHRVLRRLADADAAAAHRLHPAGRQLADPGLPGAAAGQHAGADPAAAEQARALIAKVPACESVYTTIGGGSGGTDPFACRRRQHRSAQGHADRQLAERGERPRKQVHRERDARALEPNCPARAARWAWAARAKSTCWC
jgi:hypothetical protein